MTTEEAVATAAKLFANAESALAALAAGMPSVITAVRDDGKALGAIEAMRLIATCGRDTNAALGIIADLHGTLTDLAGKLGIDLPQPRSGDR